MQYTLTAKIHEKLVYPYLAQMGVHLGKSKRKLFVRHGIHKESITELKREFNAYEGITARQFNSMAYEVKGLLSSQKELKIELIKKAQKKIKDLQKKIKKSKSAFKTHQFKRQLEHKKQKLEKYQEQLSKPSVCFGERAYFKKQFYLKENGLLNHQQWKDEWKRRRDSNFFLIGSKDEKFGNQSCQYLAGKLQLRLTHHVAEKVGVEHIEIPVQFTYQLKTLNLALATGQALSYRFLLHENGFWYVHLSFDLPAGEQLTDPKFGALGIDLNPTCIAVTHIDPYGNYIKSWQIPIQLRGKRSEQIEAILSDHCVKLVQYAKENKIPIIIEDLDFEGQKLKLRSRSMNRMLNQFSYSRFNTLITSQGYRQGVQIKEVNPAYTSLIGKVKFSLGYGLSAHMSAAMAIARRGLGFGESFRAKTKISLSLPVRNRRKHPWSDWRLINPKVFPEKYQSFWKDRLCPEHPQSEKSSSTTDNNHLSRIRKSFESEVTSTRSN